MKKYVIGVIIGIVLSSSAVYAANYLYQADEVSYKPSNTNWDVDNVDDAINELYNKISEANSALLALKNTAIAKAVGANGDTFTSVINKLGAITDQKNKSFTVSNTSSITIPAGYYNGTGKINVSGLVPAPSGTFTPSAHGTQIDMGANNTYRYINTTNVWNQAVAAADARANANSANYQAGYNAGYNSGTLNGATELVSNGNVNTTYSFTASSKTIGWLVLEGWDGSSGPQQAQIHDLSTTGTYIINRAEIAGTHITPGWPRYMSIIKASNGKTVTFTGREGLEWNGGINGYVHHTVWLRIYEIRS